MSSAATPKRVARKAGKKKRRPPLEESATAAAPLVDVAEYAPSSDPSVALPRKVKKGKKKLAPQDGAPPQDGPEMDSRAARDAAAARRQPPEEVDVPRPEKDEAVPRRPVSTPKRAKRKDRDKISLEQKIKAEEEEEERRRQAAAAAAADERKRAADEDDDDAGEDAEYGDDFEDYDEDFEDFEEAERTAKAVNEFVPPAKSPKLASKKKNPFAPSLPQRRGGAKDDPVKAGAGKFSAVQITRSRVSSHRARRQQQDSLLARGVGNFDEADDVGVQVSSFSEQAKRVAEIKSRVKLVQSRGDSFEVHALPPWEFYIRSVGAGGSHCQAFTQTQDDAGEAAVQTEALETRAAFCQGEASGFDDSVARGNDRPTTECKRGEEDGEGCPAESKDQQGDAAERAAMALEEEQEALPGLAQLGDLMEVLLEEDASRAPARAARDDAWADVWSSKNAAALAAPFASGAIPLEGPQELGLAQRLVMDLCYSPTQAHALLTAHGCRLDAHLVDKADEVACRLAYGSLLCLWDLRRPLEGPARVMACEGAVTRCVMSPKTAAFCLAGCDEGSLLVWDLRNAAESGDVCRPSFCTCAPANAASGHQTGICDLTLIPGGAGDTGFQLASLDDRGALHVWTLLDHAPGSEAAGDAAAAADPGILLGGRVKLHHVDQLDTLGPVDPLSGKTATCLAVAPNDVGHVLVGSATGGVANCARFGRRVSPKFFLPGAALHVRRGSELETAGAGATCVRFHPSLPEYVLAGFSSGSVSLYHMRSAQPLKTWSLTTSPDPTAGSGFAAVAQVEWSTSCPTVFFLLDETFELSVWDLAQDDTGPLLRHQCAGEPGATAQRPAFALSSRAVKSLAPTLAVAGPTSQVEAHRLGAEASPPEPLLMPLDEADEEGKQQMQQMQQHAGAAEAVFLSLS